VEGEEGDLLYDEPIIAMEAMARRGSTNESGIFFSSWIGRHGYFLSLKIDEEYPAGEKK